MLNKLKQRKQAGFTIIEVLIVLAIAGLIMLVVFLAVPALQRSQRNSARNSEASRISAAVTECLSNRNGVSTGCDTAAEIGINVSTDLQQFSSIAFIGVGTIDKPTILFGQKCDATAAAAVAGTARQFAVTFATENNGSTLTRCISS